MLSEFEIDKTFTLKSFLLNSKSIISFSLDFEGNVLFCNEGYKIILGYDDKNIKDYLLNPLFQALVTQTKEGLAFNGTITLKKVPKNTSFISQVYKSSDELFFLCEYDSLEIEMMLRNTIYQLEETQAMLMQSEKMNALGKLVAGVAHEINNPLAYVISNVEIMGQYFCSIKEFFADLEKEKIASLKDLKERYDLDYILKDFSSLQKSTLEGGERVKNIVSELRDYTRINASEKSFSNISECLMSSLKIVKPEIKRKAINLNLNFSQTSDIECYPAQLNQVLINMIINAVQAIGEKGNITINLYEKENFIFVEIEDNGIGILDENKSKIFKPFFTTKPQGQGVGLGLNLSYRIIKEMHKGDICFDSIAEKGTIFTISIPKGAK
ncbi:MAG TPA: ATP-binding protein [Clostridiaceae bacterium]